MKDVWNMITDEGINITKINVDVDRVNNAVFDLILEVRDIVQLSRILDRLENIPNVMEAKRVRPG
jgi:GTP pyrophosphokinase